MDYGDPRIPDRIWDKIHPEPNTGHWLWGGSCDGSDYPHARFEGKLRTLSRVVLALDLDRSLVEGEQANHTCDETWCLRPDHLYAGTHRQNMDDMMRRGRQVPGNINTVTCGAGLHPWIPENVRQNGRWVTCRLCTNDRERKRYHAAK